MLGSFDQVVSSTQLFGFSGLWRPFSLEVPEQSSNVVFIFYSSTGTVTTSYTGTVPTSRSRLDHVIETDLFVQVPDSYPVLVRIE